MNAYNLPMSDIQARFAKALVAKGWKQADLVLASGITSGGVSNWSRGQVQPEHVKADTLLRIASALGVRPQWLVYGTGAMLDATESMPSQPLRIDPSILSASIAFVEKRMGLDGVKLNPHRDADLLAWAYEVEARERLRLPPDNLLDFGNALRKRIADKAGSNDQGRAGEGDSG